MKFLFLFLDGVGLGLDDAETNPFVTVEMPHLQLLLGGKRLIKNYPETISTSRSTFLSLDACLGVEGRPQSGQRAGYFAHRSKCPNANRPTLRTQTERRY